MEIPKSSSFSDVEPLPIYSGRFDVPHAFDVIILSMSKISNVVEIPKSSMLSDVISFADLIRSFRCTQSFTAS